MNDEYYENLHIKEDKIQLNKYCLTEIEKNLINIESLLDDYKTNQNNDEPLLKILNTCQIIEDLAMVYGYEGVETLACNLIAAVVSIVEKDHKISNDFFNSSWINFSAI